MSNDLLVIVPSRGRPGNIADLQAAWAITSGGYADLLVVVDDDDPELDRYTALTGVTMVVGPRLRLGPTLNYHAVANAGRYQAIGFLGDDHRPRTRDWDRDIVASLELLGTGVAYGNDLFQGANLPTAVFMTSDIIQTLGYMVPPGMIHLYLDNAWLALGRGLGKLAYRDDVVIEHVHPAAGKATWDDRYAEVNDDTLYEADRRLFDAYMAGQFAIDVAKLQGLIAP